MKKGMIRWQSHHSDRRRRPHVLNAVERDLRQKYGRDYRIIKAETGRGGAGRARTMLKQRRSTAALFLVDQRMPEMTGVQFLDAARQLFPEARKVLLTAYADTEAAISVDQPRRAGLLPDEALGPARRSICIPCWMDLLDDWKRHTSKCPSTASASPGRSGRPPPTTVKEFSDPQHRCRYQWLDVETNAKARGDGGRAERRRAQIADGIFPGRQHAD